MSLLKKMMFDVGGVEMFCCCLVFWNVIKNLNLNFIEIDTLLLKYIIGEFYLRSGQVTILLLSEINIIIVNSVSQTTFIEVVFTSNVKGE